MKKSKNIAKNQTSLDKIKESEESQTSESEIYSSSDNKRPISNNLKEKSQTIKTGGSSADDIPRKEAPPAKKKSDLPLRIITSTTLISFMWLCFAMGHLYYSLFLLWCGFKCYFELLNINKNQRKEARILLQPLIDWYAPLSLCFHLLPYTVMRRILIDNDSLINFKVQAPITYAIFYKYHTLISSCLLIAGMVLFVLSLEKGSYRYQFKRLGWQILCTMTSISGALFFGYYVHKGYFWVVVCNGSVMTNDIMAYVFGKTMGKTKLIALSPNKTVEGFVGGGLSTILITILISGYISQYQQVICPQTEITIAPFKQYKCEVPQIYVSQPHNIPLINQTIYFSDAQFHASVIALFSSLIAPFGGFLASGLKRSLKIKDFGDSIPGHGGFADRFDCHIVCAFFVYMYLTQIVYRKGYNIERVFDYLSRMDENERQMILNNLKNFNKTNFI